jgi:hypothetical protein
MANTTLVLDASISASVSTSRLTAANDMNISSTMPMAHSAPRPGARLESLVSSFRLTVTSQPQKKNSAVSAPVANSSGVNSAAENHAKENGCAGASPYLMIATTTIMTRIMTSSPVITICV